MSEPITAKSNPRQTRSRAPWYAAAAAAVIAIVAVAAIALGPGSSPGELPSAASPIELTAGPENVMASCIVPSAEVLAPTDMAFAGTATAIDGERVTLAVTEWYKGGDADEVVVVAPAGFEALIGSVPFQVGDDFLISATGSTVNYCGLSGAATPELQAIYDEAFPG